MREWCFKAMLFSDLLCFFVIAGLDPAIHEETSTVPVVRWIPGSSPGMTIKKRPGVTRTAGGARFMQSFRKPRPNVGGIGLSEP